MLYADTNHVYLPDNKYSATVYRNVDGEWIEMGEATFNSEKSLWKTVAKWRSANSRVLVKDANGNAIPS